VSATFDSVDIGDEMTPADIDLSKQFVAEHARFLGMAFPRFTDDEGARREGLPGQITPGNLSLALLARVLVEWLPGTRLTRLGTTFRGLAPAGTTARVHATVTEKDDDARSLECDVWMESAEGDRLVIGTATLKAL
jgi:acyl dehydratase